MEQPHLLITGGAGYVGSVLVRRLLASGHRVRVLDCLLHGGAGLLGVFSDPQFEFIRGDVADARDVRNALAGVGGVIHLASIVGDPACAKQPELARRTNLDGTKQLVDAMLEQGVPDLFYASTCSNYGVADPSVLADEQAALNPVSLYAETKVESERYMLERAGASFRPTIMRFATVYGVSARMRFDLTVNDFAKEAVVNRKLTVYGEQFWRPYIHLEDLARAVGRIMGLEPGRRTGQVFNVGDSTQNYQKRTIAELVKARLPETEVEYIQRDRDPRSYRVSFEKLAKAATFRHTKDVRDGVDEVVRLLEQGVLTEPADAVYAN